MKPNIRMDATAIFFFGFLCGATVMKVIMQLMLSSIKRDIRMIVELHQMERDIARKIQESDQKKCE